MNLFQKGSEKVTKMGMKHLVSSALQLVFSGQKYLASHNLMALEHPLYFPDFSLPDIFPFR
jgi:hypothetical protein